MITDIGYTDRERGLRRYAPHLWTFAAISLLSLGWLIYTARFQRQMVVSAASSKAAKTAAQSLAYYGNGELKILAFYAEPAARAGSPSLVCYGVANAEVVTIEPSVGNTWPSTSRCLEATPAKDTQYTLVARDKAGHEVVKTTVLTAQAK